MDDIQSLLGSLHPMIDPRLEVPGGFVAIRRRTVAGIVNDLAAVDAWVIEHDGRIEDFGDEPDAVGSTLETTCYVLTRSALCPRL